MKRHERGATAVEFALVLLFFLMFLLAIVDFSRLLFSWNAAHEAARAGARYAVACHLGGTSDTSPILTRMQALVPPIRSVSLTWEIDGVPSTCGPDSCTGLRLSIEDFEMRWISPIVGSAPLEPLMPRIEVHISREAMRMDEKSESLCNDELVIP